MVHIPMWISREEQLGSETDNITGVLRQRNMAHMKEQIKTPEKNLIDKEIANLSDAEFKTWLIRTLTDFIELSHKMKEKMKATQNEIKEHIQGTKREEKKTGTQTKDLK